MRVTAFYPNSEQMANDAKGWAGERSDRYYIRTTLRCNHVAHEKRKAIVLVQGEKVMQNLITCKTCHQHTPNYVELKNQKK